jgi:hypothetical protein
VLSTIAFYKSVINCIDNLGTEISIIRYVDLVINIQEAFFKLAQQELNFNALLCKGAREATVSFSLTIDNLLNKGITF